MNPEQMQENMASGVDGGSRRIFLDQLRGELSQRVNAGKMTLVQASQRMRDAVNLENDSYGDPAHKAKLFAQDGMTDEEEPKI